MDGSLLSRGARQAARDTISVVALHPQSRGEEALAHQADQVLDLALLPTRGWCAGDRIDQMMCTHLQKAAIVLPILADEDRLHGGVSHNTMREALLTKPRKPLMTDRRAQLDDTSGAGSQPSVRRVAVNDGEWPEAAPSVEEFLQAFPAITHEPSEAMTAISAYLTGSRHMFEHGGRFDQIQSAIEQADLQATRANEALSRLRESFSKLGRF